MLTPFSKFSPSSFANKLSSAGPLGIVREFTRRTMHGGMGWIAPATALERYQPQDRVRDEGFVSATSVADISMRRRKALPGEPEDARLTGGTRSLMRRLSGLNLGIRAMPAGVTSVGKNVASVSVNVASVA